MAGLDEGRIGRGRPEDEPAAQPRKACRSQSRRSQSAAPPKAISVGMPVGCGDGAATSDTMRPPVTFQMGLTTLTGGYETIDPIALPSAWCPGEPSASEFVNCNSMFTLVVVFGGVGFPRAAISIC